MVILQKNIIFVEWPDVAVRLVSAAIDDCGSALAFAIGVSSSIKRVLQYRDHIAIADWRPIERRQFPAIRRAGKMHSFTMQRQYELVEEARRRGFRDVEVIDDDLGRSASGTVARPGFDKAGGLAVCW